MATLRAMPILEVADVTAAEAHYARLGFCSHGAWGDPPEFAIVQRGDVTLGLRRPDGAPAINEWWSAYVYVSDAHALRAEFDTEGLDPSPVEDRPYGLAEFDVLDPDGHRIAFASDITPGGHGPGLGPERGRG